MARKTKASPRKIRGQAKKIRRSEMYGSGASGHLLQGKYNTDPVYAWFQKHHVTSSKVVDDDGVYHSKSGKFEWKVPSSVLWCLHTPLTTNQMNNQYAWYVTWVSPRTGQRLRKYFMSPWVAMEFIAAKAGRVDPHAAIVSRSRPYYVIPKHRGRFPIRQQVGGRTITWYWCPLCMQPRRFRAVRPLQEFFAVVKVWNEEKGHYVPKDRKLRLLHCEYCGCTNRDSVFRRSNQPWEVRKFKKGARRARRR